MPLDPAVAREAVEVFARIDARVEGLDDRGRRRHALGRDAYIGGAGGSSETLQMDLNFKFASYQFPSGKSSPSPLLFFAQVNQV